jgi:hypothetical protein
VEPKPIFSYRECLNRASQFLLHLQKSIALFNAWVTFTKLDLMFRFLALNLSQGYEKVGLRERKCKSLGRLFGLEMFQNDSQEPKILTPSFWSNFEWNFKATFYGFFHRFISD